jgi:hypothetical protein
MIELNVFDANGELILALNTPTGIAEFFKDNNISFSTPQAFLMYLMTKYTVYRYQDTKYRITRMNMDNISGKTTVDYSPVV